jgi:hypothetical protein
MEWREIVLAHPKNLPENREIAFLVAEFDGVVKSRQGYRELLSEQPERREQLDTQPQPRAEEKSEIPPIIQEAGDCLFHRCHY